MESKLDELYKYYLEKKLDMIFDSENEDSVVSPIYQKHDDCLLFYDGYAMVKNENGEINYKDFSGHLLSDEWFDEGNDFRFGFAVVGRFFPEYRVFKSNVIDTSGHLLSNQWFDDINFYEDKGIIGTNITDTNDIIKTHLANCRLSYPMYETIEYNGKMNYKHNGSYLLKEWVDKAWNFRNGFALVRNNNKYNILDVTGKYLSDEWFDNIVDYNGTTLKDLKKPIEVGYVFVFKNGKCNCMDLRGNLLFSWFKPTKDININDYDALANIIPCINYHGYEVENVLGYNYRLSKGDKKYKINGFPIRVYDNYILCCRRNKMIGISPNKIFSYFLYNLKDNTYIRIGQSSYTNRKRHVVQDFVFGFDDNFIHNYYDINNYYGDYNHIGEIVTFIYGDQRIDITDYYKRKIHGKKNVHVNKNLSKILSIDEFHYENLESINEILKEEKKRAIEEQRKEKEKAELDNINDQMNRIEHEEESNRKAIEDLKKEIESKLQLLEELEKKGGVAHIKCNRDMLFKIVSDKNGFHYEFSDFVAKNNRYHMFDWKSEKFINVKMNGIDFRGCELDSLQPTEVYKKNLSGCNFEGVNFGPFTSFSGVDIRGSKFSYDKDNSTMDVMPYFDEAIFNETTTFNGTPLTKLIKLEEKNDSISDNESQVGKSKV